MIDRETETLLTLQEAADSLPAIGGRKPHWRTVYGWHWKGLRGVRLETVVVAGRRLTSREAIDRFIQRTTADREPRPIRETTHLPAPPRVSAATKRRLARHGLEIDD